MEKYDFQVLVIGAGPGGYVAAIRAAQLGFKVACIDKRATLGGTCLNVGCIPSKALLQSSQSFEWMKNSSKELGITLKDLSFDFLAMMDRKAKIVRTLVDGIASQFKKRGIVHLEGEAKFLSPHEIEVNGKSYSAEFMIIATGSEPIPLSFLPFDEKRVVSSTGALSLPRVPKTMGVIGGGVIGVELASVYQRLGTAVTIIEKLDGITPTMDGALRQNLLQTLKKQGIEFLLGTEVSSAKMLDQGVELTLKSPGEKRTLEAEVVIVCVGRKPYTKGLNLEAAGISVDRKGYIFIDGNFRTIQPFIYAIGDVIEGPMLAHRASQEGILTAEGIGGINTSLNYMSIPSVIYTHPEVASVGLTEEEAVAAQLELMIGISHFKGNARARCIGDIEGFVKVIGEAKTGRLLGMHIIGAEASELIAEGVMAMEKKATLIDFVHASHPHPTLSEAVMEACQQALGYPIHG